MGAQQSQISQFQISANKSILSMLMRGKEEDIIIMLEKRKNKTFLKQTVSTNGDTFLHYAAALGHGKVVKYLLNNVPELKQTRNNQGKLPRDLASDLLIKNTLN